MEFELFLIIIFILFEHFKFLIFLGIYMTATSEHFKVLNDHFEDVIKPSFRNIRVISYVLIAVVFVGGAGIWMPWAKESNITVWLPGSTVFTYSFALLGSIICNRLYFYTKSLKEIKKFYSDNLQVNEINIKFEEYEKKSILSAWGMLFGSLVIVLITFSYSKYYAEDSIFGWLGLLLSIFLYFCASAEEVSISSSILPKPKDCEPASAPMPIDEGEESPTLNSGFFTEGNS